MMASKINEKAAKVSPYLLVAAFSSLVTSWALQTPMLQRKADTLATVQQKILPSLAGRLSADETKLKQANCDKDAITAVAIQGVVARQAPDNIPAPTWSDIHGCPKVTPIKVPVPPVPKADNVVTVRK